MLTGAIIFDGASDLALNGRLSRAFQVLEGGERSPEDAGEDK